MYKVIVIEDENIIRKGLIYSVAWADLGCNVVGEAANGIDGIKLIKEKRPDIIILDLNMPVMSGLEMLEKTYKTYDYSAIILSGYSDFEYAQKAICYGVKGYLLKPLKKEELIEAIENAKEECDLRKKWLLLEEDKEKLQDITIIKEFDKKEIHSEVVKQMMGYIDNNFYKKIVMQDVVNCLNYSETYLNKVFKEIVGTTFIEYLNRFRIQKAIDLMKSGETSIQSIAQSSGISDYKYFSVVFRKHIGISPKEYIKKINT